VAVTVPALRSAGPQVIWTGYATSAFAGFAGLLDGQKTLQTSLEGWISSSTDANLPVIYAEQLIRGNRFDVYTASEASPTWRSLCGRRGQYTFGPMSRRRSVSRTSTKVWSARARARKWRRPPAAIRSSGYPSCTSTRASPVGPDGVCAPSDPANRSTGTRIPPTPTPRTCRRLPQPRGPVPHNSPLTSSHRRPPTGPSTSSPSSATAARTRSGQGGGPGREQPARHVHRRLDRHRAVRPLPL